MSLRTFDAGRTVQRASQADDALKLSPGHKTALTSIRHGRAVIPASVSTQVPHKHRILLRGS